MALLTQVAAPQHHSLDVIDLGCGTGLVGVAIAPFSRALTGVDLSPRMVEKSRERGVYSKVVCDDIVRMLADWPDHSVDVLTSADVFIYIGKLEAVMSQAQRVLRPGGRIAFSVETLPADAGQPYRLETSGRYSQSMAYLDGLASGAQFTAEASQTCVIRQEADTSVAGHLLVWRRT